MYADLTECSSCRGSKPPWVIVAPSTEDMKSITSALMEATDVGGALLKHLPCGQRDFLDFGASQRQCCEIVVQL